MTTKTALIIVDVQNDFCDDHHGATLPVTGGGVVARRINALLADENRYDLVVTTQDWHIEPGDHFADSPDFVDSWPAHCLAGTPGAALHPELLAGLGDNFDGSDVVDIVIRKGHLTAAYSGFDGVVAHADKLALIGVGLEPALRLLGITDVDVAGIATDHCVRATAIDAHNAGFNTSVLLDLCAGVAADTTAAAVDAFREAGIDVVGAS